jgi:3-oxoacyl-[acyl-carrier-protein] synthase III
MIIDANLTIKVLGCAKALPECLPVRNSDILLLDPAMKGKGAAFLEKMGNKIESRFGVAERYLTHKPWLPPGEAEETSEELAFRALRSIIPSERRAAPSLFIHGTTTTSRYTGSQAAAILGRLGIIAPAYELKAGCSTSLAALHMAAMFLLAGYSDAAIACAETLSKVMNPKIRETWFGLADGGAALWIERNDRSPDFRICRSYYSTDGKHIDLFTTKGILPPAARDIESNGYCLQGDADQLSAVSIDRYCKMLELLYPDTARLSEIQWIIPHQVNRQLIQAVLDRYPIHARLVWSAREYGNLGGASILFSIADALQKGIFRRNDRILLMSVGGGLSFAAQLWEKL